MAFCQPICFAVFDPAPNQYHTEKQNDLNQAQWHYFLPAA